MIYSTNFNEHIPRLIFLLIIILCAIMLEFMYFNRFQSIYNSNNKRKLNLQIKRNEIHEIMIDGFSKGKYFYFS